MTYLRKLAREHPRYRNFITEARWRSAVQRAELSVREYALNEFQAVDERHRVFGVFNYQAKVLCPTADEFEWYCGLFIHV